MINVECDHCHVFVLEPQESVNIYHVWKNDIVETDTSHKNRHQLCKKCYGGWCEAYDKFDYDADNYKKQSDKKKLTYSNEYCGFT